MIKKSLLATTAALALLASPVLAQTPPPAPPKDDARKISAAAQTFVTMAANGGMFEVDSSKLAVDKTKRDDIKKFAQKMIDDHSKANNELKSIASKLGAKVPDTVDTIHQAKFDKLNSTKASGFDAAYLDAQIEAHREAVTLFSNYAKTGDNAELKSFATATLPVIEGHEKDVKALDHSQLGGGGSDDHGMSKRKSN